MLFYIDGDFVDLVQESPYPDLVTVRAADKESLKVFAAYTGADALCVPHHLFPWILHVPKSNLPPGVPYRVLKEIEKVDRLTPEPAAFCVDFAYEGQDGEIEGDYYYCWPSEIDQTLRIIDNGERDLSGEPTVTPVFFLPRELTVAAPTVANFLKTFGLPEEEAAEE